MRECRLLMFFNFTFTALKHFTILELSLGSVHMDTATAVEDFLCDVITETEESKMITDAREIIEEDEDLKKSRRKQRAHLMREELK